MCEMREKEHFGPHVYPMGSIVIAVCQSIRRSLNISRDCSLIFSETLHEVWVNKVKKVTWPKF